VGKFARPLKTKMKTKLIRLSLALALLAFAAFLEMTTWFSASSVLPQLRAAWGVSPSAGAWLTISVQIGFVVGALISAALRCAPPDNKPLPEEIRNCLPYLDQELVLMHPRAVLALGGIAHNAYLDLLKRKGLIASRAAYRFSHGASFVLPGGLPRLFAAYHPSQQNTQTGRLTPAMFAHVLRQIRRFLKS
jgi:uracil-DNA glycosylase family 4